MNSSGITLRSILLPHPELPNYATVKMSDLRRPERNAPEPAPSRRRPGEQARRIQISAPLQAPNNARQAASSGHERVPIVRFANTDQPGIKVQNVATPLMIRVSLDAVAKIMDELQSADNWREVVSMVMTEGKNNDKLRQNFRRYTSSIGKNPKQLVDAIGSDGEASYKSVWHNATDQQTFATLADRLSRLFQTQIGNHQRSRLSEDEATQSMVPIVVLDLADPTGYQSSQPFTDEDINQVASLHDQLTPLFATFRDLMTRAVLPELPPVASTSGTSRADERPRPATASAVNIERQPARSRSNQRVISVRLLAAKWGSKLANALPRRTTQGTAGRRVETDKTSQA